MSVRNILVEGQVQCDEDGVMVQVSRQALTEFIGEFDVLNSLASESAAREKDWREAVEKIRAECYGMRQMSVILDIAVSALLSAPTPTSTGPTEKP